MVYRDNTRRTIVISGNPWFSMGLLWFDLDLFWDDKGIIVEY